MMILRKISFLLLFILLSAGALESNPVYANGNETQTYTKQKININKSKLKIAPKAAIKNIVIKKTEDLVLVEPNSEIITQQIIKEPSPQIIPETIIETPVLVDEAEYILGPEDKIKLTVFGEKELSGSYKLGGDSTISIPLIGVVDVMGLSLRQAEQTIETKLKDGYLKDPSVSIEVAESRPFYIMGEVRRPGSYNYINGMNVLQAVAISGGFTYRANKKSVDIIRGNATPQKPTPYAPEAFVKAGDIIFVRERFF